MPKRNDTLRRTERQAAARAREQRRNSPAVQTLLKEVATILDDAAMAMNIVEILRQRDHACIDESNCTLTGKACSALNQNLPPHMHLGQQPR